MYGVATTQGLRPTMEDMYLALPHWSEVPRGLFALFDGHSGIGAAKLSKERLANMLLSNKDPDITCSSMHACFKTLDDMIKEERVGGGTTASVCVVDKAWVAIGTVGDSRCIVCDKDGEVLQATVDHKPTDDEYLRIWNSGGFVLSNTGIPRVGGELAMSRALGSRMLGVIPDPHCLVHHRTPADAFVLMASDGVWDELSNEAVAKIVSERIGDNCKAAAVAVVQAALAAGSSDNATALVIDLAWPMKASEPSSSEGD